MSKRDLILQNVGNVRESMGVPDPPPVGGTPPLSPRVVPPHLIGFARSRDAAQIAVERIDRDPDQPREEFAEEALSRLAESLKSRGQLQPIRVRWDEGRGAYIIVSGERRWRAARMAGLPSLSCVVMEGPVSPSELRAIQVVENALREDLRPVEQARAYRLLLELNPEWSVRRLAAELAVDHSLVVRALKLLKLPQEIQEQVDRGEVSASVAEEALKLDDPAAAVALIEHARTEDLTRDQVREERQRSAGTKGGGKSESRGRCAAHRPRTFRTSAGKLTFEPKKGGDIRAALAEVCL
jgi:ParB family chromosome partitioning protein